MKCKTCGAKMIRTYIRDKARNYTLQAFGYKCIQCNGIVFDNGKTEYNEKENEYNKVNTPNINEVIEPLNLQITILQNIMRKMVPEMIKARIKVPFNKKEMDEVVRYK